MTDWLEWVAATATLVATLIVLILLVTGPGQRFRGAGARFRSVLRIPDASTSRVVAALTLGIAMTVLAAVIDSLRERGTIASGDPQITARVIAERSPAVTVVAQAFTFIGGAWCLTTLSVLVLAWLAWRRHGRAAVLFGTAMLASLALSIVVKLVVGRARPPAEVVLGELDASFAFPSGHTMNSTVFFGLVAGFAAARARGVGARWALGLGWVGLALAIGLSRIYLGYHWLTDVVAGWAFGIGVLAVALGISTWIWSREVTPPRP